MSIEENKAVIRRVAEKVFGEGDFSEIDKLLASNYVLRGSRIEVKGRESFKQFVTMIRNAFPDIHFVMDDMVGEGDKVAFHYTMRGTFKSEYMGMAPAGFGKTTLLSKWIHQNQPSFRTAWFSLMQGTTTRYASGTTSLLPCKHCSQLAGKVSCHRCILLSRSLPSRC